MKTTITAGVCLLALVLTFTIAECGLSQGKQQQASCNEILQTCITACEQAADAGATDAALTQCKQNCDTAYNVCSGANGGGPDIGDGPDGDDDDDSGATAIAGATIFSTISALLVAVASAMN